MKNLPFSYRRTLERRDKICQLALRPYINMPLTGDTVADVAKDVMAVMPANTPKGAVYDTIRVLAGTTLTRKEVAALAWRMAGNMDKLLAGHPVLPWTQQLADERVPVLIEKVVMARRKKMSGVVLHCRALAGTPCPMLFTEFVTLRSCSAISRALGFSAPWGPFPYSTPMYFVNLMFFAHIEAARSNIQPSFVKVSASSSMVKENRTKIEIRCRARPCPQQFTHSCAFCWLGYDNCEAAVHPTTYVVRECTECKTGGWFVPGEDSMICQQCRQASSQHEPHMSN